MARSVRPVFLRLVHSDIRPSATALGPSGAVQESFLPSGAPNVLLFMSWRKISESDLLDVFALSRPKLVVDMRVAPRFDLGNLTRKRFFSLIEGHGCQYIDLFGRIGIANVKNALANPTLVASSASGFLAKVHPPHTGPVVFLYDDDGIDDAYVSALAKSLPHAGEGWQVFSPNRADEKVERDRPVDTQAPRAAGLAHMERRTIFISHATPEDNAFVNWLTSKLVGTGYEVWCDIANLGGGDAFWRDIEETIRERAAKVVFVQSRSVKGKAGARKEVYLALKVGEKYRRARFVVPVRIDATPFDETFIELIDLQAIDCRRDWLSGLKTLLALFERDRVPKNETFKGEQLTTLISRVGQSSHTLVRKEELLVSNLLSLVDVPPRLNFFSCAGIQSSQLATIAERLAVPAFAYYSNMATTASLDQFASSLAKLGFEENAVRLRASLSWSDFLNGRSGDLPTWTPREARNNALGLLNKAWNKLMESRKASTGSLANGRPFWFYADQHLPNNKVQFKGFDGRLIRRQLVGFSGKRRVYWHFGIQARSVVNNQQFSFSLTPHVTFSVDGKTLLPSKSQLHSLRRSFCRSWWNNRWRDLLQGFVSTISEGQFIELQVGAEMPVSVSGIFTTFRSHVSLVETASLETTDQTPLVDDEVEDEWDEETEDDAMILDESPEEVPLTEQN